MGHRLKHLILMRHAKAAHATAGQADRDRPLAERGHRDAILMGRWLADSPPDLILCSPSLRTMETMEDVVAALPDKAKSAVEQSLYGGQPADYLGAIAAEGGSAGRLLVIGHNPTIHETALMLAREPDAKMRTKFPTGAAAVLAFDIDDWSALSPGMGELLRFLRPKDLGASDADD
jgi:phosphohistidine phosphatase